ncbi:MAG: aldo/keto reductase [Verrucomicrobia bacterium]|nr:aldo/keto reductase [Leptolyngbya sp. ES-bin-22]
MTPQTRRTFLATSFAIAGGIVGSHALRENSTGGSANSAQTPPSGSMPERELGQTGIKVLTLGLGGAGQTPLSRQNLEAAAVSIVERALALGIRYFDTAVNYGPSEDYLGKVLPAHRQRIFLASKTDARDRDGAWRDLERLLKRLKTDYLNLWQLHHVSFTQELDTILSKAGAIHALEEAKRQKLVRFGSTTGHHDPAVIAAGLGRYPFDIILVAFNAADKHHPRPFASTVLPVAGARRVGVVAMKVPAYGRLFNSGALAGMHQAMGYTLSLPGVHCCVIAAATVAQLEHNVTVARAFKPLVKSEMAAIEQRTATTWQENIFFRSWT